MYRFSGIIADYLHIESRVFHTQSTSVKIIWIYPQIIWNNSRLSGIIADYLHIESRVKIIWIYLQIIWNNSRLSAYRVPCVLHAGYQCQDNLDFIYRLSGIIADYLHIESRVCHTQGTSVKIIWILQCQNCIQSVQTSPIQSDISIK